MSVTYSIEPGERIVYLTTTGDTSFAEWRDAMLSALSDPSYQHGFNFLSDRREETDVPDTEYVRAAANFLREHNEEMAGGRWAAVSDRPALYGMMRMFTTLCEMTGITAAAFIDYEEARRWLLEPSCN